MKGQVLHLLGVQLKVQGDSSDFSVLLTKKSLMILLRLNDMSGSSTTVSTSLLPCGGITYLINSFDYPNLLCFNFPPTQHQFL